MDAEFIDLTAENIADEHLCCIIRMKKPHTGVEAKREWLAARIYCLWVLGAPRGSGYGRALMEYCIADAKAKGKSGICMLGAKKQKSWLSDQSFAKKFGFTENDLKTYAAARGGKCFDVSTRGVDFKRKTLWECANGHTFKMTPYSVLCAIKNVNSVVHSVFLPIVRRICHNRQF